MTGAVAVVNGAPAFGGVTMRVARTDYDALSRPMTTTLNYRPDITTSLSDTNRQGGRLPHLWLPDGTSLYDRLGSGLSLLRLRDDGDAHPLIEAAIARRVPLNVVEVRGEALEERYGAALILVRPDQHVAWRGTADRRTAGAIIDVACGL